MYKADDPKLVCTRAGLLSHTHMMRREDVRVAEFNSKPKHIAQFWRVEAVSCPPKTAV